MNRKYLMMAAVAAALAGPIAAHAQQADQSAPQQSAPQQSAPMPNSQDTSTNPQSYGNTPAATVNPATQAGAPASATMPADNTGASQAAPTSTDASGNSVVSNGPVADTPANRAKYGKPMSMAGRMTKPAGN